MDIELGIGSRIIHPQFGKGVIIQEYTEAYDISFIEHGIRRITKDYGNLEVIEAVETADDLVS